MTPFAAIHDQGSLALYLCYMQKAYFIWKRGIIHGFVKHDCQ